MDMVGYASGAVTLATVISRHGGKVSMKGRPDRYIKNRRTVFSAEDNMGDKQ